MAEAVGEVASTGASAPELGRVMTSFADPLKKLGERENESGFKVNRGVEESGHSTGVASYLEITDILYSQDQFALTVEHQ